MASSSLQTNALQRALQAARTPSELATALIDPTDAFTSVPKGSGGYPMGDAVTALLSIGLRRHAAGRVAVIQITAVDLTATYTTDAGGTAYAYNAAAGAPADLPALVNQWAGELNADAGTAAILQAASDGVDTVTLTWRTRTSTSLTLTQSGAATATLQLEYEGATVYPYVRAQTAVRALTGADRTVAEEAVAGWQPPASGGVPTVVTLTNGQGWSQGADVGSIAAVGFVVESLAVFAGDQAVGTAGGITTSYRTPHAWAAPGVVST